MAKLKLSYDHIVLLSEWLEEKLTQVYPDTLPECISTFVMLEFQRRINVWLASYHDPKRMHRITARESELCALIYTIHRTCDPQDHRYMELSRIKRAIEEILFVKGNLNPKIYA